MSELRFVRVFGNRPVGARLFWWDPPALLLVAGLTPLVPDSPPGLRWLPLFVLGHFLVFCNVVRMHRSRELAWAGVVVLAALAWGGEPWRVMQAGLVASLVLIPLELGSPGYHGVFAERVRALRLKRHLPHR